MPETGMQALVDGAIEYAEEIRRSGHYIVSNALQGTQTARTIRVRTGNVSTSVGPFAETKEQLGEFFVIDAKDMDEACAIAARFPPARVAVIEVRPVQELKHSRDRRGRELALHASPFDLILRPRQLEPGRRVARARGGRITWQRTRW